MQCNEVDLDSLSTEKIHRLRQHLLESGLLLAGERRELDVPADDEVTEGAIRLRESVLEHALLVARVHGLGRVQVQAGVM